MRPAVQVYILTDYASAAQKADSSHTPLFVAKGEIPQASTLTFYFQKRAPGLAFADQYAPAGGTIDSYDLTGRSEFPSRIVGPHHSRNREPLDSRFEKHVRTLLKDGKDVASLNRAILEYVLTADPTSYLKATRETALREVKEETGIRASALSIQLGVSYEETTWAGESNAELRAYNFEQWALVLDKDSGTPRIASPEEASAAGYFTALGAIECAINTKCQFTPKAWEFLIETALVQSHTQDATVDGLKTHSSLRKHYRALIHNFSHGPFESLLERYTSTSPPAMNAAGFLDYVKSELESHSHPLQGLAPGGPGFAAVPIGDVLTEELLTHLKGELPPVCFTTDFLRPGVETRPAPKGFETIQIRGSETYLAMLQELGAKVENYLNRYAPIEEERGRIELYHGEVRRTSAEGPRLPPTVFHYDEGNSLFLNVVITLEGPLTVVDLEPPIENLELARAGISHGPKLAPPNRSQMTEPGYALINSTITRANYYKLLGMPDVGISYHSAPDYPGARLLVNYKFRLRAP